MTKGTMLAHRIGVTSATWPLLIGHDRRRDLNASPESFIRPAKAKSDAANGQPALMEKSYFELIGGAIFSAGACGSAAFSPSFCAAVSGLAGSGAGVVGRVPPGLASAGTLLGAAGGCDCSGGVACANREFSTLISSREAPATTSSRRDHGGRQQHLFPVSASAMARRHLVHHGSRNQRAGQPIVPAGNRRLTANQPLIVSRPASLSSAAKASLVPSALQANAVVEPVF